LFRYWRSIHPHLSKTAKPSRLVARLNPLPPNAQSIHIPLPQISLSSRLRGALFCLFTLVPDAIPEGSIGNRPYRQTAMAVIHFNASGSMERMVTSGIPTSRERHRCDGCRGQAGGACGDPQTKKAPKQIPFFCFRAFCFNPSPYVGQ
jgi:hypothetical protein